MGWDACTMEPNAWLRWLECHPGLAGYLQTIGAVIAIGVAVASPWIAASFADRQARKARAERTWVLIGALKDPVQNIAAAAARAEAYLEKWKHAAPQQNLWPDFCKTIFVSVPTAIDLLHQQTDVDPKLIAPYREVQTAVMAHNTLINEAQLAGQAGASLRWSGVWTDLHTSATSVLEACQRALGKA
jgi:hypothetical protein